LAILTERQAYEVMLAFDTQLFFLNRQRDTSYMRSKALTLSPAVYLVMIRAAATTTKRTPKYLGTQNFDIGQ
jgi:hypothetical protein